MKLQYARPLVRLVHALRMRRGIHFMQAWMLALLAVAVMSAPVAAAALEVNVAAPVVHKGVRAIIEDVAPALLTPVDQVPVNSLQLLVSTGHMDKSLALKFHQVFILGQAPANQPTIAHLLSLPEEERVFYSLQQLTQAGALTPAEAQFFLNLRSSDNESTRAMAVNALQSGSFGPLATAILQVTVDLTAIDTDNGLKTCAADASSLRAQGWLGNALSWLGGLAKAVVDGAINGALIGWMLGGREGAILGGIYGGIAGGIRYVKETTGNGFMPGPNGEDCTGWPYPFPGF